MRVYRQPRRLLLTLLPVVAVFSVWDLYAIAADHWAFDPAQTVGLVLPGGVPVEELLFFVVVPICAVLAFEAVRRVKGWRHELHRVVGGRRRGRAAARPRRAAAPGWCGGGRSGRRTRSSLVFQLLTNGWLTGPRHRDVRRGRRSSGARLAFAPVEDLLFGFSLVLQTLSWWVWWGRLSACARLDAP